VISSFKVCCAVAPTPFCAVICTWYTPMSLAEGVPSMVKVPVAKPCGFKLLAWKFGGRPVTVKYIPVPTSGPVGGVGFAGTGAVDRLGYPVAVTAKEPGAPTRKYAVSLLPIFGAS
jgi:hypothetical protein